MQIIKVLAVVLFISSTLYAKKIPPEFYCDKCGIEITTGDHAKNDVTCYQWNTRFEKKRFHLCDKHFKAFNKIMYGWLYLK